MKSITFSIVVIVLLIGYPVESLSQSKGNFNISNSGNHPSLANDPNGGIYVVWDNIFDAIHAKHLDPSGTIEDSIAFSYTDASIVPRLAVNSEYSIFVWDDRISNIVTYFKSYISGNIIHDHSADTTYIMFNNNPVTNAYRGSPDVKFLNDSTFLVAWAGNDNTYGTVSEIFGQIVSVSGTKINDNFIITDHTNNNTNNYLPRIVSESNEKLFFVIWRDNSSGRANFYGRKFDFMGTPQGSSFLISDDTAITNLFYYSVALDTSGNFVVAWIADKGRKSQIEWRWYQGNGTPLTGVEILTPLDTLFSSANAIDISIDENNRIIMEWEQQTSTRFISKIYGQRYLSDRSPFGIAFKVSTNDLINSFEIYPNVTLRNGTIFTVWQADTSGIMGRIVDFDSISLSVGNKKPISNPPETYSLYR
jgi:hypothetical protein